MKLESHVFVSGAVRDSDLVLFGKLGELRVIVLQLSVSENSCVCRVARAL